MREKLFHCVNYQNMNKTNRSQDENPMTPIMAEPMVSYGVRSETRNSQKHVLRDDIHSAIDGEELLNLLRPRIKSLFK